MKEISLDTYASGKALFAELELRHVAHADACERYEVACLSMSRGPKDEAYAFGQTPSTPWPE